MKVGIHCDHVEMGESFTLYRIHWPLNSCQVL